jgi:hypothetical protein
MVDDQNKNMIPRADPQQPCAQKRACAEIERLARFLTSNLKRSVLALNGRKPSEVQDRQIKLQFGQDNLSNIVIDGKKNGSQRFVTGDN